MKYDKELTFVEKLLQNFRMNLRYITGNSSEEALLSRPIGLQDILNYNMDSSTIFQIFESRCKPNTLYRLKTPLLCHYILFRLPDTTESVYAYVGPYILTPISKQDILKLAEQFKVEPGNIAQLEQFYMNLPLISDESLLFTVLYTLGEYIWNDANNFTISDDFQFPSALPRDFVPIMDVQSPDDALLTIQILEQRYKEEQQLMQAVSAGQLHKAELTLSHLTSRQPEARTENPVRDMKNFAIILNTILRKAAESANIPSIQIHTISSQYARKIELITSQSSFTSISKEMVRKYCLLVQNHSLKTYSKPIRRVITEIDYDLTADLSLKSLAQLLNINPSYLSTLFKRETGSTLTEYVNRKRVDHAILLLNTTDMQIQNIALYCGIPDVNYFTKTFKKIVGKTPKEYRQMVTARK